MASVPAIRVNDEKNLVDYATDRLDSDLAIFATIVQSLQCGTREDARGVFEAEAAFVNVASAFGFVPTRRASVDVRLERSVVKPAAGLGGDLKTAKASGAVGFVSQENSLYFICRRSAFLIQP
jgi:hypothetical protein